MKKALAVILFFIYLSATSGIIINAHYCMKSLVSVKLFETGVDKCRQCGMEMHDNPGCCHDDTRFLKLVNDQVKVPGISFELPAPQAITTDAHSLLEASLFNRKAVPHFLNHSPPLLSEQDTYLRLQVFRI
ncbi:MAG TPA: hypothetical protein PLO99_12680 [Chitinophagaceae bacterium]|nr:hypothetical protein [Chitinophagaceae bacterium]